MSPCDYASPSVINAYLLSLSKEEPKAMDYFLDLSRAFDLSTVQQSFDERKPFIRLLNLSGKSYGLAYVMKS